MTLLHVLDVRESVAYDNNPEVRARLEARMRKMIEGEDCLGLPLRTEIGDGTPYRRILKYAEETSADLLVINLQSSGLLEREFLGSTAERVIRSSRIPVLSIPCATSLHFLRTSSIDSEENSETSKEKIA
jgi:nucleotide-binding universal stress UspA family protein